METPPARIQDTQAATIPIPRAETAEELVHKGELKEAKKKAARKKNILDMEEPPPRPPMGFLEKIVSSTHFDVMMGLIILLNTLVMFVSGQMRGMHEGWKLGLRDGDPNWSLHASRFDIIEDYLIKFWIFCVDVD